MRGIVIIPTSIIEQRLAAAGELKARLENALDELEVRAGRPTDAKRGGWRHAPLAWPPDNSSPKT